jgi:copper(I)-binding protein
MLRRLSLACLMLVLPLAAWSDGPSVRASHVWIRQAPPGVTVLAGYLTLENLTDKPLTLTGLSSPEFGAVELHKSTVKDNVESMEPVARLDLAAHASIEFKSGGYHVMLMQPKKNLFAGDTVTLDLTFSDGSELAIMAPVRRDAPAH